MVNPSNDSSQGGGDVPGPSRRPQQRVKRPQKIENLSETVLRIWSYMSGRRGLFTIVLILVLLSAVLSLLGPFLLGLTVDNLIEAWDTDTLITMLLLIIVTYVLLSVALWLQNYWMIDIAQAAVYRMRNELFTHIQRLPIMFFQKRQSGELMSRLTNDVENVSRTLNSSVIQLTTSVLTLIGTIGVMLWLSPLLTVLTLTIVPFMFFGMNWITKRTNRYFRQQQKHLGDLNGYIEETLSGHTMVKAFSQEQRVIQAFSVKNAQLKEAAYWAQVYSGFIPKLMNSLNNLSFTIIISSGALMAINEWITIGTIVIFITYARQFTRPLNDLANQFNVILSAVAGAERVFQIMDEDEEYKQDNELLEVDTFKGEVTFENVSFGYDEYALALDNISFEVNPGQMVALVGPTGAGKTTIISLLMQFYHSKQGTIKIDGYDIEKLNKKSLRTNIATVLQDTYLFETTVRENIRYGRLEATDDEVIAAAKTANAHQFIEQLSDGYDTILTENGSGISQGQRQLLAIARAMLANPSILILDEATSSIDTITELKITKALTTLMEGRTSFVIAHRLNTVEKADQILVLNHGRIIEAGTHASLLKAKGFYANLFQTQTKAVK
ncbi:ABC transporter ATP-binding protein [Radiobacillus sp. PE A8.2]|uniref:ABC transporter ATP-binding protein n=1 Tax=Radiobacillus sp. PE A8.2 TaxID=3380349 RepID=UPI003890AFF8